METKKIRAVLIIEILGKPPEHIIETLKEIIKQISEEKGVSVTEKKIKEPVPIKDKKDVYTSFAEIEIEVEEILSLGHILFKYMPSHIEILSPELIVLTNNGWTEILNEISRRLHSYDEVARVIQIEKRILENKLRELLNEKKSGKKE